MTTHALNTPTPATEPGLGLTVIRYLDLVVLALALPLFLIVGLPLLGYAVTAVVWIAQRADRARWPPPARRPPTTRAQSVGVMAGSMLGRGWLTAGAILAVGLLGARADGLAAAVLAISLFTIYFASQMIVRPFDDARRRPLPDREARRDAEKLSTKGKVGVAAFALVTVMVALAGILGSAGRNNEYQPQNEFKLDPWVKLKLGPIDMSINKGVMYVFLAAILARRPWSSSRGACSSARTTRRPPSRPAYEFASKQIVGRQHRRPQPGQEVVPVHRHALLLHPLLEPDRLHPAADQHRGAVPRLRADDPVVRHLRGHGQRVGAAGPDPDRRVDLPLRGHPGQGPDQTTSRAGCPAGTPKAITPLILVIEVISQFVRIISLSVRLFANILAGHLLILFMGGGLIVILGIAAIGALTLPVAIVFFMFEVVLIAGLQAFIFATLTSIYLGEATAEGH